MIGMKNLINVVAALVLCTLLAACRSTRPGGADVLRVGTYNIRLSPGDRGTANDWEVRKGDLVSLVRQMDLDVFGLQEVCPDQAAYLRQELREFALVGEHREADRVSGEASPIAFRPDRLVAVKGGTFWLSETPEVPGSKGWNAACPRVCTWAIFVDLRTQKSFCFANTHTDHMSAEAREKGLKLILKRLDEVARGLPVIFTGDHNCRETEIPALAVAKKFDNALYASKSQPQGPWRTFNGWRFRGNEPAIMGALMMTPGERNVAGDDQPFALQCGGSRIDYIYVSPQVSVLGYETHGETRPGTQLYPSDHFPCVATVKIK